MPRSDLFCVADGSGEDGAEHSCKRRLIKDDFPQWPAAIGESKADNCGWDCEQPFLREQVLRLQQLMDRSSLLNVAKGTPFMIVAKSVLVNILGDCKEVQFSARITVTEQVATRLACPVVTHAALLAAPTTSAGLPTGFPEKKAAGFKLLPVQLDIPIGRFERATFRSIVSDRALAVSSFFPSVIIDSVGDYLDS